MHLHFLKKKKNMLGNYTLHQQRVVRGGENGGEDDEEGHGEEAVSMAVV